MTPTPTYTIKRLEFHKVTDLMWCASTIFGDMWITSIADAFYLHGPASWFCNDLPTLESAQEVAAAWYRERLAPALEQLT